jgi:hypothetical protein
LTGNGGEDDVAFIGNSRSCSPMRVRPEERTNMVLEYINPGLAKRVILPRRGFIKGLAALLGASAAIKAVALTSTTFRRPPLAWATSGLCGDMLALNGAEVEVAEFPDLFSAFGYLHGGADSKFLLPDTSDWVPEPDSPLWRRRSSADEGEWFITPHARPSGWAEKPRELQFWWRGPDNTLSHWRSIFGPA